MKRALIIWLVKILYALGSLIGKGTSMPGAIALKLCPDILKRLQLPKLVVAVTGSNGKTTTVEMIARAMEKNGMNVAWNKGGSNQIEGVTTMLCRRADRRGKVRADAVVIESDERYARYTFSYFTPTHFVITNLFRDQMTRNGHPEWIAELIEKAVSDDTVLVLNADDPLVARFGKDRPGTIYFGMAENAYSTKEPVGCYEDCPYCPVCQQPLTYDYYHFAGLGRWHCESCGFETPPADVLVTDLNLDSQTMEINGSDTMHISFAGRYFVYNLCAAYAVCTLAGISGAKTAEALSGHVQQSGRVAEFEAGERRGVLLTGKHENSVSYNQGIEYVARAGGEPAEVCVLVNSISRKYFTGEISWLWDVNFEQLNQPHIQKILLCGRYAYDLATRFSYTGIPAEKIEILPSVEDIGVRFREKGTARLYVITCFSDQENIYRQVHALTPVAK